ncbi:eCIS core domain-containing protein [Vineibacter terrae]|nr:DUF4157 domain-containing protein [Vineibacter terrae]
MVTGVGRYYPEIDLRKVRFAVDINTGHGQAITIGYRIFFPRKIDLDDRNDVLLMLHELEHVVQYERRGGIRPFLAEYIAKIPTKIIERRRFNIHDDLDIERAANAKADRVITAYYGWNFKFSNACNKPIDAAIRYLTTNDEWVTVGYWRADPGQSFLLADDDKPLRTRNGIYYVHAHEVDGERYWGSERRYVVEVDNETRNFSKFEFEATRIGFFTLRFTCDN